MVTDADLGLVGVPLEVTESVNSNILVRCAGPLELVCPLDLLSENMAANNTENLGTELAVLIVTSVEEEPDTTLGIIHLPLHGSNEHSESSSEMMTDTNSGVVVANNMQKDWTCHLPLDHPISF